MKRRGGGGKTPLLTAECDLFLRGHCLSAAQRWHGRQKLLAISAATAHAGGVSGLVHNFEVRVHIGNESEITSNIWIEQMSSASTSNLRVLTPGERACQL
eukprot:3759811-Amphidinium_carterae.1